jgi:hypothetical protein
MIDPRTAFDKEKQRFETSTEVAKVVSKAAAGMKGSIPTVMASIIVLLANAARCILDVLGNDGEN